MATFQGIDYRGRRATEGLKQALTPAMAARDLDGMADAIAALGAHYSEIADQVGRLDTKDVDEDAVAYARRFAEVYRDMSSFHVRAAAAARENDANGMNAIKLEFARLEERRVAVNAERKALFETLSNRYSGRTFDSIDHD